MKHKPTDAYKRMSTNVYIHMCEGNAVYPPRCENKAKPKTDSELNLVTSLNDDFAQG